MKKKREREDGSKKKMWERCQRGEVGWGSLCRRKCRCTYHPSPPLVQQTGHSTEPQTFHPTHWWLNPDALLCAPPVSEPPLPSRVSFLCPASSQMERCLQEPAPRGPSCPWAAQPSAVCLAASKGHPNDSLPQCALPPPHLPGRTPPRNLTTALPLLQGNLAITAGQIEGGPRTVIPAEATALITKGWLGQTASHNRLQPLPAYCPPTAIGALPQGRTRHWALRNLELLDTTGCLFLKVITL